MEPESGGGRLLLVDDDGLVLRTHVRILSEYAPLSADDGFAAREILRQTEVDVVVCDLGMPRLSGLDLMRWAKEHCPRPLWIVVSAQDTFDAAAQALKLGAFDFICKPILPIQLRTAVANAIRHQRLLGERARLVRELADNNRKLAESLRTLETAHEVLREQRTMLDQDLLRAERIMRALLPNSMPSLEKMRLNVGYRPSNVIGGDLYGAAMLDDHRLAVYVADAAGHGVSAALLAVLFKQRLRLLEADRSARSPAAVLVELNRDLYDECRASGLFVTVVLALIDTVSGAATIASAGHPPALLIRSRSVTERLEKTGPALGLAPDANFGEHRLSLATGDRLLLYSDGLTTSLHEGDSRLETILGAMGPGSKDGDSAIRDLLAVATRSGACEDDTTLLLLTAESGVSTVDADATVAAGEIAPDDATTECMLRLGVVDGTTWVAVQGRAIWKYGAALRDACLQAAGPGRRAVLDLGACTMLDSTVLGTLHELVSRGFGLSFCIQNVSDDLRALFVELTMTQVLSCIADRAQPLPARMAAVPIKGEHQAQGLILRAHELLAELSPHNAEEFAPVIEALRHEASPR
jgi:serine phosphatase RsbU (regulator of sigma subunit)/anti-anti-sigma regulatory factor